MVHFGTMCNYCVIHRFALAVSCCISCWCSKSERPKYQSRKTKTTTLIKLKNVAAVSACLLVKLQDSYGSANKAPNCVPCVALHKCRGILNW